MVLIHNWRLIDTGHATAPWNMAVDEALLGEFCENDLPIFRLYGWKPSLSFGRFSKPAQSVDLSLAEKRGVSCVRRITGGGILVHGGDLSYSIILPSSFAKERGIKGSYSFLCRFLIRLYEKLGLDAGFVTQFEKEEKESNICLAGSEAYDILIDGIKMGGNAQRHIKKAMLQHGSIPIYFDRQLLEPLFLEDSGLKEAASLHDLGIETDYDTLSALVVDTFCETFDARAMPDVLNNDEVKRAKELLKKRYMSERWTLDGQE